MFDNYSKKNILIITYPNESGLFYLGRSLGDLLKRSNNVYYAPKPKYKKMGRRFEPYIEGVARDSGLSFENIDVKRSFAKQIIKICRSKNIDQIISFETFMMTAQWVTQVKSALGIPVFDVPMSEWVDPNFLKNNSYQIFDKILCLTDTSFEIFKKYKTKERVSWDYVDGNLFTNNRAKRIDSTARFYHQASLNPNFSQKNTANVIRAFLRFDEKYANASELTITGRLTDQERRLAKKSDNIRVITEVVERKYISEIYSRSDCVICPSTREGLGLSFFEAKRSGCSIITTDVDPMNKHTDYLCEVIAYNTSDSMVPFAETNEHKIFEQIEIFYKDFIMSEEIKKKTKKQIEEENASLMAAFESSSDTQEASEGLNQDTLSALRAKMNQKNKEDDTMEVVDRRDVSIEISVIGVGQAGSRIAEVFHKKGYDVGVINTSAQDLEYIEVLPHQKLLLEGSLGGTGKDLDLGREIFEESVDEILPFIDSVSEGNNMLYLAISGGGGTGSSSVDTLIPMLFETGMPVGVVYVLPKATEDAKSKQNSIETLSRLARMTAENMISNLIVVDNARIEQIYANLSQSKFWETSNNAIVEPLHVFNSLTAKPSRFTSLDPSDFGKIISCGDCSTYGVMQVDDYMEETALAEAVIDSLGSNMLAAGFDLSQTRAGGVIITGSKEVLDKIPAININYCFHMISEQTNGASIFQGVYDVDSQDDCVKIYSWFAGLGLPKDRVESLKRESRQQEAVASEKEKNRTSAMTLDLDEDRVSTVATEINRKIQKKKSGFNRLQKGGRGRTSIIDKRKRR